VAQEGGTAEARGFAIRAIEAAEWDHHPEHEVPGQNGMYRFEMDGIRIAHMGDVGNPLTRCADQDFFEDVDVLLALAGGYLTIELPDLMEMIHRVRPKLVIPMHFRTLTYRPRNTMWIESFLAHFKDEDGRFRLRPYRRSGAATCPTTRGSWCSTTSDEDPTRRRGRAAGKNSDPAGRRGKATTRNPGRTTS
jgi:L-ascorbate metabolism protein UlaG (beta-lactamase superfamily)